MGAVDRVMARAIMGQAPAAGQTTISPAEAAIVLQGLNETLRLADNAKTTGWRCTGVADATFEQGRALRTRLMAYVSNQVSSGFSISKAEVDAAEQILSCSNEATAAKPNTGAYIVLGVVVAGAAIFFTIVNFK